MQDQTPEMETPGFLVGDNVESSTIAQDLEQNPDEANDDNFYLDEGTYPMRASELDNVVRSMSHRAGIIPTNTGTLFVDDSGNFCYMEVGDVDPENNSATVSVTKGDYDDLVSGLDEDAEDYDSDGFFDSIPERLDEHKTEYDRMRGS